MSCRRRPIAAGEGVVSVDFAMPLDVVGLALSGCADGVASQTIRVDEARAIPLATANTGVRRERPGLTGSAVGGKAGGGSAATELWIGGACPERMTASAAAANCPAVA
jgi:hypothetical protein